MSFSRYVALGDSFTEGVGDPDPTLPNGLRGWADRVAEVLATKDPSFQYANLAIRGRKLPGIIDEQVEPAIAMLGKASPADLVTIHGGGNDVIRPRVDLDALGRRYSDAIRRLKATGATVVIFTLPDVTTNKVFGAIRGRIAIFNEHIREIRDRHDVLLTDMWRNHDYDPKQTLDEDRLHLNPAGHQMMAIEVLNTLGLDHGLLPLPEKLIPLRTPREQFADDLAWARNHAAPWVGRRLQGKSSGDNVEPKYPALTSLG